jgi:2-haloalkanoic acid dehalogenase type II
MRVGEHYDAVLFDLLSGLLDSWALWDDVAGGPSDGRRWRGEYLRLTYSTGAYRPYEQLVAEAAAAKQLSPHLAPELIARWDELEPWPEAPAVLTEVAASTKIGVVTNCSIELGRRAVHRVGAAFDVVVTAEEAGAYKPRPEPYARALELLGTAPERTLFVAGSRYDLFGAAAAGMPVWWHNRVGLERGDAPDPRASTIRWPRCRAIWAEARPYCGQRSQRRPMVRRCHGFRPAREDALGRLRSRTGPERWQHARRPCRVRRRQGQLLLRR